MEVLTDLHTALHHAAPLDILLTFPNSVITFTIPPSSRGSRIDIIPCTILQIHRNSTPVLSPPPPD
jgi:hypothetical protein